MRRVRYWRSAHKRHSVRALMLGTLVSSLAGAWSALPGALIDQWPTWIVLSVPAAIFALGLLGAYVQQNGLED